eukprot:scaffold141826_cov35-Attheya_sp.AAC.2
MLAIGRLTIMIPFLIDKKSLEYSPASYMLGNKTNEPPSLSSQAQETATAKTTVTKQNNKQWTNEEYVRDQMEAF